MNFLVAIENPFFYVPVLTFIFGQLLKFLIKIAKGELDFKYLIASGGMPSVHTATIVSLATAGFIILGPKDPLFGVLLIFAAIVVYDSFGVRRSTGEQAKVLNQLIKDLDSQNELHDKYHRLREVLGHKPEETLAGAVLGIILGAAFTKFSSLFAFFSIENLFAVPIFSSRALQVFVIIFGAITIWAVVYRIWSLGRKMSAVKRKLTNRIFIYGLSLGITGLAYAFMAFQQVSVLSFPIWIVVGIVAFVIYSVWLYLYYTKKYRAQLEHTSEQERKQKWMQ